jgi:hypothetical protein
MCLTIFIKKKTIGSEFIYVKIRVKTIDGQFLDLMVLSW